MGRLLNKPQCACKPLRFERIEIERSIQKKKSDLYSEPRVCLGFFAHAQQSCPVRVPSTSDSRLLFCRRPITQPLRSQAVRLVSSLAKCEMTARRKPM